MNVNTQAVILALILWALSVVFIAAVGYAFVRLGRGRDRKSDEVLRKETIAIEAVKERDREAEELKKEVVELQRVVAVMRAEAVPQTAAFLAYLQAKAKHFHTPDLDKKIGKLKPDVELKPAAKAELEEALAAEAAQNDPLIDREEQLAKRILLDVQEMAVIEFQKRASGEVSKLETLLVSHPARTEGEETEKKDKESDGRNA